MTLKQLKPKKLLASDESQKDIFGTTLFYEGIGFKVTQLDYLEDIKDDSLRNALVSQLDGAKDKGNYFTSAEGLELLVKREGGLLLVVSAGEANRGQYKLFIEGLWEL